MRGRSHTHACDYVIISVQYAVQYVTNYNYYCPLPKVYLCNSRKSSQMGIVRVLNALPHVTRYSVLNTIYSNYKQAKQTLHRPHEIKIQIIW